MEVLPIRTQLGESPLWDAERGCLWFIDIPARALHRLDAATLKLDTWPMPELIGSLGLCRSGRLLVALRHGLHFFDPKTARLERFVVFDEEPEHNRLNDGKVAPDGAFWVGSMDADSAQRRPTGVLYRITAQGRVEAKSSGLKVSNGLAWSADGAATDVEGGYWSAGVSAGCLNRWSREGDLLERVALPVPNPTMPCFAGDDMKTVYVASLTRAPHENGGAMVRLRLPVAGVPVARFPL